MTTSEELQLIREAKEGKVQAFTALYRAYFDRVYKYCAYRLPNREHAEDVTSRVFEKLVEQLPRLKTEDGHRLSAWLFRVAHNQIVDFYRKNKWEEVASPAVWEDLADEAGAEVLSEQEAHWLSSGRQAQVAHVLSQLKHNYQEVLTLKFHLELETPEIAAHLDMREKQVYVLLHRALKAFRALYLKIYPETEIF